jgi:hypothetical protein
VLRSWREVLFRAELDAREASLVRAMGIEVVRFLERQQIPLPPEAAGAGQLPASGPGEGEVGKPSSPG